MEETLKQTRTDGNNCLKVVFFGPESSGKTTVSRQLASYFNTVYVPEYMRVYLQKKWDDSKEKCTKVDLMPIAIGQMKAENEASEKANKVLICDTNLLEIKVYSEYYYDGFCPSEIKKYAQENTYDLYFLTYIDTKWQIDDLRDRPDEREEMFRIFEAQLIDYNLRYEVLKGSQNVRFGFAVEKIEKLLKEKKNAYK
ncbi:AAA family ATPase [Ulvibacter antarcticus]|uniref:NadR type nicotinamide-nucleotide adenylyltransferase n=1 Tax=Ulvibacter antarcticus TaxID=442714 RepID=A0A3L9Z0E4_9FLAO|nr:ATP-binding protein [Ulvibacter antarcticus]RMA66313.1 NadR type nicotinamide-nucleotide adenylyltransferase [Ulvibacter antarcticus]